MKIVVAFVKLGGELVWIVLQKSDSLFFIDIAGRSSESS